MSDHGKRINHVIPGCYISRADLARLDRRSLLTAGLLDPADLGKGITAAFLLASSLIQQIRWE
jgi:hypothetical protein